MTKKALKYTPVYIMVLNLRSTKRRQSMKNGLKIMKTEKTMMMSRMTLIQKAGISTSRLPRITSRQFLTWQLKLDHVIQRMPSYKPNASKSS